MGCLSLFSAPHFLFRSAATVFLRLSNEAMFLVQQQGVSLFLVQQHVSLLVQQQFVWRYGHKANRPSRCTR